ncbi:MAG: hypothetical protein WC635_02115 [Bacteriovorax sp.]|jgi:cation:H+ antiporter
MTSILFQFLGSALVIIFAGSFLTRFADKIAETTGWGRMFVGGLLLAGATSLPELMVDLKAVQLNLPDLAVGDLLGSSLFNLLILAVLDFSYPSAFRRTSFSPQNLHHSLAAVLSIFLTTIVGIGISSKVDAAFLGVSIFSWGILGAYFFGLRLIFIEGNNDYQPDKSTTSLKLLLKQRSFIGAIAGYIAAASTILLVAPFLVNSADGLAKISGLGHTFIGTTLVALATSLPELVSTLAAFRIGKPDLALGNIFGSNAFNMILFVPLDFLYPKVLFSSVQSFHSVTAFCIVGAMSVAVMGQIYRKKERSRFTEPSSEVVVILILLFLYLLYHVTPVR